LPPPGGSQVNEREGSAMNWNAIEAGWKDYKGSAKQQWEKLSVEQVAGCLGKREHLSSRVQEAYGISKEEAERQVADWQSRQRPVQ
jgi:uncharacterized protein YjbJ (UPF0337 family)